MCAAFHNADREVGHRIIRVKLHYSAQPIISGIYVKLPAHFPPEYLALQEQTLEVLRSKLEIAVSRLGSLLQTDDVSEPSRDQAGRPVRIKRLKYALVEDKLNKAIDDLETWQNIFDPSWYLLAKAATPQIDDELSKFE